MDERQLVETVRDKQTVFEGLLIHVEHWNVTLPNGESAPREIVCHRGASAVVAVDEAGRIILVRQHRVAVDRVTWEIPAGKLDTADEDPFLCAQRELSEETGLTAAHWKKLTILDTTPGFCNEHIHLYYATGLEQGACHPDEDEFVAVVRMPLAEAVAKVMDGTIRDGKTIAGILMAANLSASDH